MITKVSQSGGFAGGDAVEIGWVDTLQLPAARAERVRQAVESLRGALAESGGAIGADLPEYRIEIEESDGSRDTLIIPDDMDPANPTLKPLRDLLSAIEE